MTHMHRYSAVKWTGLVAIAALAACSSKTPSADEALQRDLNLANGAMLDLAPQGGQKTQVVSAVERSPESSQRPSTTERRQTPKRVPNAAERDVTPTPEPAADVVDVAVAPAEEPTPAPTPAVVPVIAAPPPPAPLPRPAATPQRRGGYKTVGDVIRNAPFPVNP
jgi:hypothetical protein